MRWEDATKAVAERSYAACGLERGEDRTAFHGLVVNPADMARRLLSGHLGGEELEDALAGLSAATTNTLVTMALSMEDERGADPRVSLYLAMTQMLLQGLLVGGEDR